MATPIFLSPALPSELLSYILNHHGYPTTLLLCFSQADFLTSISDELQGQTRKATRSTDQPEPCEGESSHHYDRGEEGAEVKHTLLSSPLCQVATSRHIRVIYVPTVTHLRTYLSVSSPHGSNIPAPLTSALTGDREPHIIIYGFLKLHRGTSEWSAQGLSNTASTLVELAHRLSWKTLLIEPRSGSHDTALERLLQEVVPILNGGARRLGLDPEEGAWTGRTVKIGRILGRWLRFQRAQWGISDGYD